MNFQIGPYQSDFDSAGWNRLFAQLEQRRSVKPHSLAGALLAQVGALVISFALFGLLIHFLTLTGPDFDPLGLFIGENALPWWLVLIGGLAIVPAHELLHALLHPGWGLTHKTTIGVWLSRLSFYTHYAGERSRNRLLLGIAAPFTVLSLLPAALVGLGGDYISSGAQAALAAISLLNGLLSAADFVQFLIVLLLIPKGAVVRSHRQRLYWR